MRPNATITARLTGSRPEAELRALAAVVRLPDGTELAADLGLDPLVVGSGVDSGLRVADPGVSKNHCELHLTEAGVVVRDLASKNGVMIGGVRIREALLQVGAVLQVGGGRLSIEQRGPPRAVPLWPQPRFGDAVGMSLPMRVLFARLAQAAQRTGTLLLWGESGTGKELLARAVHGASAAAQGPFVVLDVGGISPQLVEAALFGYEKGAFTGANEARRGLFAEADRGTLCIDGIDELAKEIQPRLLRVLESGEVRPLGGGRTLLVQTRIIATSHRELRKCVTDGTFREDLFFRLSVFEERVPPLRERREDIALLVERFVKAQVPPRSLGDLPTGALDLLGSHHWPGNVRELQNTVSRLLLFPEMGEKAISKSERPASALGRLGRLPLKAARERLVREFEHSYLEEKLKANHGNISETARASGLSRQSLYDLLEHHGLRGAH